MQERLVPKDNGIAPAMCQDLTESRSRSRSILILAAVVVVGAGADTGEVTLLLLK
jgi:hypothetical protein